MPAGITPFKGDRERQRARSPVAQAFGSSAPRTPRTGAANPLQRTVSHRLPRSKGYQHLSPVQSTEGANEDRTKKLESPEAWHMHSKGMVTSPLQSNRLASTICVDSLSPILADNSGVDCSRSMSCCSRKSQEYVDTSLDMSPIGRGSRIRHISQNSLLHATMNEGDKICSNPKAQSGLLEQIHEIVNQLNTVLKDDIARLKANFESKLYYVEENLIESVKLRHNLMQTSVYSRLSAVDDNTLEHERIMTKMESRLKAVEESLSFVPELRELIRQHFMVQQQEVAKMKIHHHKAEQKEEITNLMSIPEDRIAVTEDTLAGISKPHTTDESEQVEPEQKPMHASSNINLEQRLSRAEGNIDVIATMLGNIETRLCKAVEGILQRKLTEIMQMSSEMSTCVGSMESSRQVSESSYVGVASAAEALTKADHCIAHLKDMTSSCDNVVVKSLTRPCGLQHHEEDTHAQDKMECDHKQSVHAVG